MSIERTITLEEVERVVAVVAERRTWREAALLVVQLLDTVRGEGPEQRGQRRAMRRVLTKINLELVARGGDAIDDGQSWSEGDIDEGLRA